MNGLNRDLFLAINGSPDSARLLVAFAIFSAKYLIALVPLHLIVVWLAGNRRMRFVALSAFLALVIAIVINQAIGLVAYSPRPFVTGLGHQLIEHRDSSSLPSNHATVFFAYAATLILFGKRGLALIAAALGILVAWSRIFLGIHYPVDMLAAAVTSTVAAFASVFFMARYGTWFLERSEHLYRTVVGGAVAAIKGTARRT